MNMLITKSSPFSLNSQKLSVILALLVLGGVSLMTAGILSLLFVATIPEDMEREDEQG